MNARTLLLLAVPISLSLICARATSGNTDLQAIQASTGENYRRWVEATKHKDVDAVLSIYDDDAIVLPPDHDPVIGQKAIREFYKSYYSGSWQLVGEEFKSTR